MGRCTHSRKSAEAAKNRSKIRSVRRRLLRRLWRQWKSSKGPAEEAQGGGALARRQNLRSRWTEFRQALKNRRNDIQTKLFGPRTKEFIGCYNCRTLKAKWKKLELIAYLEAHKMEICAVQEHRTQLMNSDSSYGTLRFAGWDFVYSGATPQGCGGVGFLLSSRLSRSIAEISTFSSRIIRLKLVTGSKAQYTTYLICVYAPTDVASDDDKNSFYNSLRQATESVPSKHLCLILGDFNARLDDRYVKFPMHTKCNDNGERLAEFMEDSTFASMLCGFRKRKSQNFTHVGPRGIRSRIDHCLCSKRWKSSILNCELMSPDTVKSDHKFLRITLKRRFWTSKARTTKSKPDYGYLLDPNSDFKNLVVQDIQKSMSFDPSYSSFVTSSDEACLHHLPKKDKRRKAKLWKDKDILAARQHLSKTRSTSLTDQEGKASVAKAALDLSQLYTKKQEQIYDSIASRVNSVCEGAKVQEAFDAVNELSGRKARQGCGIVGDTPQMKVEVLKDHFQQLLNAHRPSNSLIITPIVQDELPVDCGPITIQELEEASHRLKNNKASGMDNIPSELLKLQEIQRMLLPIFNDVWTKCELPSLWQLSSLVAIPKKGNLALPSNYRGIALLSSSLKLFNRIIYQRLQPHLEPFLLGTQNGFRGGRSCAEHILTLRRLIEECETRSKLGAVLIFVDFAKAFDSIDRDVLFDILTAYGVPRKLIDVIKAIYSYSRSCVLACDATSSEFTTSCGVLQGCTLSPYLFITVLDYVLRSTVESSFEGLEIVPRKSSRHPRVLLNHLAFADDVVLIASSMDQAQNMFAKLENVGAKVGLQINYSKTKIMKIGYISDDIRCDKTLIGMDGCSTINQVEEFCYLGSHLRSCARDFASRRALAFDALNKLWRVWKSNISRECRVRLFKSLVESIYLYGMETYSLTKTLIKRIDGGYSLMLRKALQIPYHTHTPNSEVFQDLPVPSQILKAQRLRLVGHCLRATGSSFQPASDLVLWTPRHQFKRGKGRTKTFTKQLGDDFDLLIDELPQLRDLAHDRHAWKHYCLNLLH